jgi:hypothetical protein
MARPEMDGTANSLARISGLLSTEPWTAGLRSGQDQRDPRHVGSGVRAGPLQEVRRERSGVGRRLTPIIALLAGLASVLGLVAAAPIAVAQPTARSGIEALARTDGGSHGAKPTVVLAHGSWADGSSWNGVIERLQRAGYPVRAVYNPLRGLANDSAVLAGFLSTIPGPVVLAAHS